MGAPVSLSMCAALRTVSYRAGDAEERGGAVQCQPAADDARGESPGCLAHAEGGRQVPSAVAAWRGAPAVLAPGRWRAWVPPRGAVPLRCCPLGFRPRKRARVGEAWGQGLDTLGVPACALAAGTLAAGTLAARTLAARTLAA